MRVERKKPADAENAPAYKIILTDTDGAEINKGYFNNFEKSSPAALQFLVKEMKHLASLFDFTLPETVESHKVLLDATMKLVNDNCSGKTVNVFVAYGTKERPRQFLELASAFAMVKNTEKPYVSPKAQMERITPTNAVTAPTEGEGVNYTNDLPFDAQSGTPSGVSW